MATTNLSEYDPRQIPDGSSFRIAIVVAEWNAHITNGLLQGAFDTLVKHGVSESAIHVHYVPGSYELPLGAKWLAQQPEIDGVICLGSVIQGQTRHFDFVCQAASDGILQVSLESSKPVIFVVLTDNNEQQAIDRSGGKLGNKGVECAVSCLKMLALKTRI